MAKRVQYVKQTRSGIKTILKDNSVLTGRQKIKMAKYGSDPETQKMRMKTAALRAGSANMAQAITGATGSIVSGQAQSEATKRAAIDAASNAAKQATSGGLSDSTNSRDDDDKKGKDNPWVY